MDDLLKELAERHGVPGAQLVVRVDGDTHSGWVGEGIDEDTAFPVGSLTKPYTAALAMELVDDEDLELDDPLSEHIPALSGDLTLRMLLSHTGGVVSIVDDDAVTATNRLRWITANATLVHEPGTVFSYSNIGYVIVGQVVESVTGMSWREAVSAVVLRSLGTTPCFVLDTVHKRQLALGHSGGVPIAEQGLPVIEEPNGGLAVSARDLLALTRYQEPMTTDQLKGIEVGPFGLADGWGLGWARYGTWFGHDGTGDGTSCHLRFDPASDAVVALTTSSGSGVELWHDLVAALRAEGIPVGDHTAIAEGAAVPGDPACAGRYVNGATEFVVSLGDDGELVADLDGDGPAKLECRSDLRFTVQGHTGRFLRDGGSVNLLQLSGRVARRA